MVGTLRAEVCLETFGTAVLGQKLRSVTEGVDNRNDVVAHQWGGMWKDVAGHSGTMSWNQTPVRAPAHNKKTPLLTLLETLHQLLALILAQRTSCSQRKLLPTSR
ncbi:hypothetical protein AN398_08020 [Corynebacterium pseudotuberculosis]|nr:hypothetical protein AN902_08045 [Corynebacterium pseudotuberculosis]ALU18065.1 hypothetical protein AN397_08035 [Corynebacterium pseudotuberculosis]ALU20059.1 hypothetical protein AK970_08045 [Corynebacterium pseudotuberculosis]ALU22021.1 hypothetical protein AN398_08020 [Corynebacterium pseudotuberculosis]